MSKNTPANTFRRVLNFGSIGIKKFTNQRITPITTTITSIVIILNVPIILCQQKNLEIEKLFVTLHSKNYFMSKTKTKAGQVLASVWGWFHHLLPAGNVSVQDIMGKAAEGVIVVNVGRKIIADLQAAPKDPAAKTKALTESLIKHLPELPADMQGTQAEDVLMQWCNAILDLGPVVIETAVKAALGVK